MCHVVVDIRVDSGNIVFTGSRLIFYQQKKIVHYKIGKFSFTDLVFSWKELFNISWLPCFNSRMPYNFNPCYGNPSAFLIDAVSKVEYLQDTLPVAVLKIPGFPAFDVYK